MSLEARRSLQTLTVLPVSSKGTLEDSTGSYKGQHEHPGQRLTEIFLTAQCPAENCNGERAYFFQLQIRSADEPMTTFLKVSLLLACVRYPF
jgi:DNA-directed RNA polymerase subunit M/transcription elongation factor TFIIS